MQSYGEADNGQELQGGPQVYARKKKKNHLCKSNKWQTALDSTSTGEKEREGAERESMIEVELQHQRVGGGEVPDTAARTCQMGLGHKFHYKASKACLRWDNSTIRYPAIKQDNLRVSNI